MCSKATAGSSSATGSPSRRGSPPSLRSSRRGCFYISGSGNTIEGNKALDIDDDAFYISGDGNVLIGNLAQNCGGDGFDINGDGNTLENCTAKGAMGEGLDNSGTNTEVTRGSFTGNRIDIAGNSNFSKFEGVKFVSGGETQVPELD